MLISLINSLPEGIRWRPHIGDPTFTGWLITISYFAAFIIALLYIRKANLFSEESKLPGLFWLAISGVMFLLGFNKQLDLQNLFTDIARVIAKDQGWYDIRQRYQLIFVLMIVGAALSCVVLTVAYLRPLIKRYLTAFIGLALVGGFIILRASAFQHVDKFIASDVINFHMNWIFELSGVGFILFCLGKELRKAQL